MNPEGAEPATDPALDLLGYLGGKALETVMHPLVSEQRIYWLYLLTSGVLGVVVFLVARPGPGTSGKLVAFMLPRDVFAHPSAVVDYKFFLINRFVFFAFIAPVLLSMQTISDGTAAVLSGALAVGGVREAALVDHLVYTACLATAGDFGTFFAHYLQHRLPALWEFHKTHHSAGVLTPITVYRMHPVDDVLGAVMVAAMMGVTDGVFRSFYASSPVTLMLLNLNVFVFLFFVTGYNLRHSHIWLSYPQWLSRLLISPAQHQIHHSVAPVHHDRNMGFILALWDGLFGTLYVPTQREELSYGLDDDEHLAMDSVWQLYSRPFRMLLRRYFPRRSSAL